ncbi:MAG: hypothetical protein J6D36_07490, partial [Erysipelotrichaceae bacterium]|nr:hypothetical protein [Erysipelotrichaceae bacterium]
MVKNSQIIMEEYECSSIEDVQGIFKDSFNRAHVSCLETYYKTWRYRQSGYHMMHVYHRINYPCINKKWHCRKCHNS